MAGLHTVRVYGKLRTNPEFVGRLSEVEPDVTFGDWLDRAVGFAYHEGGAEWEGAYTAGPAHGLLFRHAPSTTIRLFGTVIPSQDSVGRAFPLMAVTTAEAPAVASLPVSAQREFFVSASGALRDARRAGSLSSTMAILSSLRGPSPSAAEHASDDFERWLQNPLAKLWKALFPRQRSDGGRRALEMLRACALEDPGGPARYLRLPLGTGAGAAASFWLHALERALGGAASARISMASWSLEPEGSLLVALAPEPPLDFWLRMWLETPSGTTRGDESVRETLSAEVANVVASRDARIGHLLDALGPRAVARAAGAC